MLGGSFPQTPPWKTGSDVTGRKYAKGDRVLVTPAEQKSFQWALDQGKLKKTGGRQRKKVDVKDEPSRK